jgi:hypothetical protein
VNTNNIVFTFLYVGEGDFKVQESPVEIFELLQDPDTSWLTLTGFNGGVLVVKKSLIVAVEESSPVLRDRAIELHHTLHEEEKEEPWK